MKECLYLFTYLLTYLFIYLFIYLFTYLFIYLFVCLFVCLFIYSFICLFKKEISSWIVHLSLSFAKQSFQMDKLALLFNNTKGNFSQNG